VYFIQKTAPERSRVSVFASCAGMALNSPLFKLLESNQKERERGSAVFVFLNIDPPKKPLNFYARWQQKKWEKRRQGEKTPLPVGEIK